MNKIVLITGGAQGIGWAIAIELAKQGYDIVIIWNKKADVKDLSYRIINKDIEKIFLNSGIK